MIIVTDTEFSRWRVVGLDRRPAAMAVDGGQGPSEAAA